MEYLRVGSLNHPITAYLEYEAHTAMGQLDVPYLEYDLDSDSGYMINMEDLANDLESPVVSALTMDDALGVSISTFPFELKEHEVLLANGSIKVDPDVSNTKLVHPLVYMNPSEHKEPKTYTYSMLDTFRSDLTSM